jgi:hypothetical protein
MRAVGSQGETRDIARALLAHVTYQRLLGAIGRASGRRAGAGGDDRAAAGCGTTRAGRRRALPRLRRSHWFRRWRMPHGRRSTASAPTSAIASGASSPAGVRTSYTASAIRTRGSCSSAKGPAPTRTRRASRRRPGAGQLLTEIVHEGE